MKRIIVAVLTVSVWAVWATSEDASASTGFYASAAHVQQEAR